MRNKIKTQDGTRLFLKDWGSGQPIVFSHGWPLTADAWDAQMFFFGQKGYRVVAHDRRGHGRSSQPWNDNTMDRFADDLAEVIEQLDLKDVILVGHSTGGGEVTRYVGRHGTSRVAKIALLGAIPPLMLRTSENPEGQPVEVFDELRQQTYDNRAQFFRDLSLPFYGYNREGAKVSEGIRASFWRQSMQGSIKSVYDSIKEFSESDFAEDLKRFDVPTLIVHGDDDQIVPIEASALLSSKLVPGAELKIYPGAPHGLAQTRQDEFNADLLAFIQRPTPAKTKPAQSSTGMPSRASSASVHL